MNNEPVAWMIIDVDNGKSLQFKENKFSEINIPLYTAPRDLSDEEIPILTILQSAHSVRLGDAIYENDAEYEKLKKIVLAAVKWTEGRMLNVK